MTCPITYQQTRVVHMRGTGGTTERVIRFDESLDYAPAENRVVIPPVEGIYPALGASSPIP